MSIPLASAPPRRVKSRFPDPFRRGPFQLRLHTGRVLSFRDAAHRGAAWETLHTTPFDSIVAYVECATRQPNGYSSFIDPS